MNDVVSFGPFRLFMAERLLKKADEPFELGSRALDILVAPVERAGEVVTHKELISRVWPGVIVEEANLRVHVSSLRKALTRQSGENTLKGKPPAHSFGHQGMGSARHFGCQIAAIACGPNRLIIRWVCRRY
jgi:hypothetical protein